eukprot:6206211-Pleurochrysis_carterae.AAC.7
MLSTAPFHAHSPLLVLATSRNAEGSHKPLSIYAWTSNAATGTCGSNQQHAQPESDTRSAARAHVIASCTFGRDSSASRTVLGITSMQISRQQGRLTLELVEGKQGSTSQFYCISNVHQTSKVHAHCLPASCGRPIATSMCADDAYTNVTSPSL